MARADTLARIKAGEGFIYAALLTRERRDVVKIGFSLTPIRRVYRDLANFACYSNPRLLGYVSGSLADEWQLHKELHGRPISRKAGNYKEEYPISVLDHPALPTGIDFSAPKGKRRAAA